MAQTAHPVEFERVIQALNESGVRYVVVGGLAVLLHGVDRLTAGLDIVLELEGEPCLRGIRALTQLAGRTGHRCAQGTKAQRRLKRIGAPSPGPRPGDREAFAARTPEQRLAWRRSALILAYRSGALKVERDDDVWGSDPR